MEDEEDEGAKDWGHVEIGEGVCEGESSNEVPATGEVTPVPAKPGHLPGNNGTKDHTCAYDIVDGAAVETEVGTHERSENTCCPHLVDPEDGDEKWGVFPEFG